MEVRLGCGRIMKIDADDYQKIADLRPRYAPGRDGHGSVRGWDQIAKKSVAVHRIIMDAPEGVEVDHINRDPLDNRRENLRLCDRQQNARNRRYSKASDLPKGVFGRGGDRSYRAFITVNAKQIALGSFDTPVMAAVAYDRAAVLHFGAFAQLNFDQARDWILPEPNPTKRTMSLRKAGG